MAESHYLPAIIWKVWPILVSCRFCFKGAVEVAWSSGEDGQYAVTQVTFIWGTYEEKTIPWHQEAMER